MDKPISNKVVVGLLVIAVLVAFSPVFTGNNDASDQGALAQDAECWLEAGGTADDCNKSNAERSAEYADSYDQRSCRGWRGWFLPRCW
jgi:hypothetical protein